MASHPLEPVSRSELQEGVSVMRNKGLFGTDTRVIVAELREPPKEVVLRWKPGMPFSRNVRFTVLNVKTCMASEIDINLEQGMVTKLVNHPGKHTSFFWEEFDGVEDMIKQHPDFVRMVKDQYGLVDMDSVSIDLWANGYYGNDEEQRTRLIRTIPFFANKKTKNPYAYPIDGIRPVVDLNAHKVVRIENIGRRPTALPHFDAWCAKDLKGRMRRDVVPINTVQSCGPSFKVNGHQVEWQGFNFVVGFNCREGLTLHDIRFQGRPVLFRAALAEMIVPYGCPSESQYRRNAFDVGECGIGMCARPQKPGIDVIGVPHFFDAEMVSGFGDPWPIENAVSMVEDDYGILWKHADRHTGANETRRSRRLVISTICTLENYDYIFNWIFYLDGTIEFKVILTGFLALGAWDMSTTAPKYGTLVAPGLYAPNHQHIFNVRLDFNVDGVKNTVSQVDVVPSPLGPQNEYKNAFYSKKTPFRHEQGAKSNLCVETSRTWEISNPSQVNDTGLPVAYRLIGKDNMVAHGGGYWRNRARFVDHHLWVTPFNNEEYRSAGKFPNQQKEDDGLPVWTEENREIENKDVVVWYTFGVTHIPRPEDYPVMPATYSGFLLKPNGFFDRNPSFDVPPQEMINPEGKSCHACA